MFELENLKAFAKNHPVIMLLFCWLYGVILGLCIVHDLRYYGLIKK